MKKVIKLTESDLLRIIAKVINESDIVIPPPPRPPQPPQPPRPNQSGTTQKITNHELSNWISFKLGPKVLSGDFVSKGSLISFNGKQYSKHLSNSRAGSGTWEKSADVIKLNFK
jgi:uncharacterized membrane protein